MQYEKRFILKVIDNNQKEICTLNKGRDLSYLECKNEIIKEMEQILDARYLIEDNFYLVIIGTNGDLYQCLLYKWLFAQYNFDYTKTKIAFDFLLDCLFIFGEWTNTYNTPKDLVSDLCQEIQNIKDKKSAGDQSFKWGNSDAVNNQKVINGKTKQEWAQKQQEYDKQRLDLVKEWHQE